MLSLQSLDKLKISAWANLSIRAKILSTLIPSLIIIFLIANTAFQASKSESQSNSRLIMQLILRSTVGEITAAYDQGASSFKQWTDEDIYGVAIEMQTTKELSSHLNDLISTAPEFSVILVTDITGKVVSYAKSKAYAGVDLTNRVLSTDLVDIPDDSFDVQISNSEVQDWLGKAGATTFVFRYATKSFMGDKNGYLLGYFDYSHLSQKTQSTAATLKANGLKHARVMVLQTSDQTLMSDSEPGGEEVKFEKSTVEYLTGAFSGQMEVFQFLGKKSFVLFQGLTSQAGGVASEGDPNPATVMALFVPTGDVLAKVNAILRMNLLIAFGGMVVLGIIIFIVARSISNPVNEITKVAVAISEGRLGRPIGIRQGDEVGKLAEAFRDMQNSLGAKTEVARQIAEGVLDQNIQIASDEDELGIAMRDMLASISGLNREMKRVIEGVRAGNLSVKGDESNFDGGWAALIDGLNHVVEAFVEPLLVVQEKLKLLAVGQVPGKVEEEYKGDFQDMRDSLNACIRAINGLVEDSKHLAEAGLRGELKYRADADQHQGDYRAIIEGINETLDQVMSPIEKASQVLAAMANGDLSKNVEGVYQGDHAVIQSALNATLGSINNLMTETLQTIDQVTEGSNQLAHSSQALSDGANQQAAAMEEISSSISEIEGQTKRNEENASLAAQRSTKVREAAEKGNSRMSNMLDAMNEIQASSEEVGKIIKVIDEIAFQTNLLALNAAVEAARAGVHGKGFAVVAEEVRNLASRSAAAASETTELIERSTEKTKTGVGIAKDTAKALQEIVEGIGDVSTLVDEIHVSSREQTSGIEQVATGVGTIDQITQQNSANAEEGAATSEELANRAQVLKSQIGQFKLSHSTHQARIPAERRKPRLLT